MAANCHNTRKYYATLRNAPGRWHYARLHNISVCYQLAATYNVHPKLGTSGLACETRPSPLPRRRGYARLPMGSLVPRPLPVEKSGLRTGLAHISREGVARACACAMRITLPAEVRRRSLVVCVCVCGPDVVGSNCIRYDPS